MGRRFAASLGAVAILYGCAPQPAPPVSPTPVGYLDNSGRSDTLSVGNRAGLLVLRYVKIDAHQDALALQRELID